MGQNEKSLDTLGLKPLLDRLDKLIAELNDYAYGRNDSGYRFIAWEEFASAAGALERAQDEIKSILY